MLDSQFILNQGQKMITQVAAISVTVNSKSYNLLCDPTVGFADLKEALFQLQKVIAQHEDAALQHAKEKENLASEEEKKSLEVDPEQPKE